ncbi:MAG: helix-turn-helix transcriptional regulator [Bacteroidaceae bacterium]|nr:helix-turn-helix transcriptional regulator [Bacteroidaceae bacterium]
MSDKSYNRFLIVLAKKNLLNKYHAVKLGRDQATISTWVKNSAQPSLETLIQIPQYLDIDVHDFIRIPELNPFKDYYNVTLYKQILPF